MLDEPRLVLLRPDGALDPAGRDIADSDSLLPAGPTCRTHESAERVLGGSVLPIALVTQRVSYQASQETSRPCPYRRVNPGDHAARDDETSIPILGIWLLTEVVDGQFPRIERAVNVHSDDVEVGLCWFSVWIC